jgi:hypothetical protein
MTAVPLPGAARPPFVNPEAKARAKVPGQADRRISQPHKAEIKPATAVVAAAKPGHGTQVSFGERALHAIERTGEFVGGALLAGVEDLGEAACYAVKAAGHGVVHAENAASDVWGLATQAASVATNLASTLGTDAQVAVTDLGTAATDIGIGARAVLSGVGSIASSAANYGSYVVKQGGKVLNELT